MTGIFCAIDAPDLSGARDLIKKIMPAPVHVKLGLEFFVAEGPQGVENLRAYFARDTRLFLDLKLHDIPNTVAGAVRSALRCRPDVVTLHAAGGRDMMQAAAFAARDEAEKKGLPRPRLLGVTVLTNLDARDLEGIGMKTPLEDQVLRLAALARESGLDGVVCSPHEIARLRRELGPDFLLVVPGIRPQDSAAGDQKRTMTPAEAAALGADYLVIGRPITRDENPAQAARAIIESLARRAV